MRILVTGATGTLGRAMVPALVRRGHEVRALSRRERDGGGATWVRGDLSSGAGIREAALDCDAIVHLAGHGLRGTRRIDVSCTLTLVSAARHAEVSHLLYVSMVGADGVPTGLLRHKFEAERVIRGSGLGHTVLRTTRVHQWLDRLLRGLAVLSVLPVDRSVPWQPVDSGEVAALVARQLAEGPRGDEPLEFGGPQVLDGDELVKIWLRARGLRRARLPVHYPGRLAAAQRTGALTTDATPRGRVSWREYLSPPMPVSDDFAVEHTASPTSPASQPERDPDQRVYGGDEGYQRQTRK